MNTNIFTLGKSIALIALINIGLINNSKAQSDDLMIEFGRNLSFGTARTLGTGNAFGAVGADLGSIGTNPAGLGLMRGTEFSISPMLISSRTSTTFANDISKESKTKMGIGNFGASFFFPNQKEGSRWKGWSIGLDYNRTNDFNKQLYYSGRTKGTMLSYFTQQANGYSFAQINNQGYGTAYLASATGLIYAPTATPTTWSSDYADSTSTVKTESAQMRGNMAEFNLAFGCNYNHKIYFGGSINFHSFRYEFNRSYTESGFSFPSDDFHINNFNYNESYSTVNETTDDSTPQSKTSFSVSGTFGLIARPITPLRLGLSVKTPTILSAQDVYDQSSMKTSLFIQGNNQSVPQNNTYEATDDAGSYIPYNIVLPARVTGSAAFFFGKHGFISADVDWQDYSTTYVDFNDPSYKAEEKRVNDNIAAKYQGAFNLRFGGEYAYEIFRVRAGYSYSGSPLNPTKAGIVSIPNDVQQISFGAGIRTQSFFLDFAYAMRMSKFGYAPYDLANNKYPVFTTNTLNSSFFVVTAGFKL